jgi:hypothetical protein
LPVVRRVICRFAASNPVGRFSTPVPERKQKMMRAAGVHLMGVRRVGLGDLAGP